MKVNVILSMMIAGVLIYTSISSFAASLLAFYATGMSMLSPKALGLSLLFSAVITGLFYLLTLWVRRDVIKNQRVSFPFITTLVSIEDYEGDNTEEYSSVSDGQESEKEED